MTTHTENENMKEAITGGFYKPEHTAGWEERFDEEFERIYALEAFAKAHGWDAAYENRIKIGYDIKSFIRTLLATARAEGRNEAVDYIKKHSTRWEDECHLRGTTFIQCDESVLEEARASAEKGGNEQ